MQKKHGIGKIGSLDINQTNKKLLERKVIEHKRTHSPINAIAQPSCSKQTGTETCLPKEVISNSSEDTKNDSNEDFKLPKSEIKSPWQIRVKLKNTALTSDHFGLSDRPTAAVASSLLQDFSIVADEDNTYVVDKNKLKREKSVNRSALQI